MCTRYILRLTQQRDTSITLEMIRSLSGLLGDYRPRRGHPPPCTGIRERWFPQSYEDPPPSYRGYPDWGTPKRRGRARANPQERPRRIKFLEESKLQNIISINSHSGLLGYDRPRRGHPPSCSEACDRRFFVTGSSALERSYPHAADAAAAGASEASPPGASYSAKEPLERCHV
jgi:hypothetical protein